MYAPGSGNISGLRFLIRVALRIMICFSYKYEAIFVEREAVRELQVHVEKLIETGIDNLSSKRRKRYWKFARNPFR